MSTEFTVDDYNEVTKEQLIADFKVVAADVEALLKASADEGSETFANLRNKAEQSLAAAKSKMADAQESLVEKGKVAAKATDEYVHENPWKSVGLAAAVGLVIGLLIAKR